MKNKLLKKLVLFIHFCFFTTLLPIRINISKNADPKVPWNFELYNKSNQNIIISLNSEGVFPKIKFWQEQDQTLPPIEIKSGTKLRIATLDLGQKITIKLWQENDTKNSKAAFEFTRLMKIYPDKEQEYAKKIRATPSDFTFGINLTGRTALSIAKGLNIRVDFGNVFLTWDGNALRPQKGPLKGWTGKTDSGLSLKNNIKSYEIIY